MKLNNGDEGIRQCVLFARLVVLMEIDLGRYGFETFR